jgi:hypothetical protein
MTTWAADELREITLGDARLNRRYIDLVDACAAHVGESLPTATGSPAAYKALCRLFDDEAVSAARLLKPHQAATRARARTAGWVLLIQDTTSYDFTSRPAMTGLGRMEHVGCRGVFVHSTLAVSVDGVPLGVLAMTCWARETAPHAHGTSGRARGNTPTAEKESQRWLDSLATSQRLIAPSVTTVTIADREADFYDFFLAPRRANAHLLIRARFDRAVTDATAWAEAQWAAVRATPEAMRFTITVPRQHKAGQTKRSREATLTLRYTTLTLAAPGYKPGATLTLQHILVEEVDPPAGEEPICWQLLTTLPITSPEVAALYVEWYTARWLIERFHYTLKSGCAVEAIQFRTRDRWACALVTYSIVAWRVMQLQYHARTQPDVSCACVLTREEWQVAQYAATPGAPRSAPPPTLQQAVRLLARLGGFRGRKCDGEPGIKALWRGWRCLQQMLQGYRLAQQDWVEEQDKKLQSVFVGTA